MKRESWEIIGFGILIVVVFSAVNVAINSWNLRETEEKISQLRHGETIILLANTPLYQKIQQAKEVVVIGDNQYLLKQAENGGIDFIGLVAHDTLNVVIDSQSISQTGTDYLPVMKITKK
jgi:hypothetical protein